MSHLTSPGRRCAAPGCTLIAVKLSRYCTTHRRRFLANGDPNGRALTHREMRGFRSLAATIMSTYGTRPDVIAATRWINERLLTSHPNLAARAELSRLRGEGVTGVELLTEVLAVFAYSQRFPNSLTDGAHLTRQLGRSVVRLRRKRRVFAQHSLRQYRAPVSAKALTAIGLAVREVLSVLLLRLLKLHEHDTSETADMLAAIKSGLPTDPPDLLLKRTP